ncbi:MAG: hypothetical protein JKY86_07640 [Gammaproteobacteria bacterium]|nr:hypothetical protein [Gammaproteobacteria bacterium]
MKKGFNQPILIAVGVSALAFFLISRKFSGIVSAINPADPNNVVNRVATSVSGSVIAPFAPSAFSDDELFARATLFSPFASAESRQQARNLLDSLEQREGL